MIFPQIHLSKIIIEALNGITNNPTIRSDIDKLNMNIFEIFEKGIKFLLMIN